MAAPFKRGSISLNAAIRFVADFAYPKEPTRTAIKRVRARVAYARRRRQLHHGSMVDAREFFDWAEKRWPRVSVGAIDPPYPVVLRVNNQAAFGYVTGDVTTIVFPKDLDEYKAGFLSLHERLGKLQSENARLVEETEALRTVVEDRAQRDAAVSRQRREAGRKGGRPRRAD